MISRYLGSVALMSALAGAAHPLVGQGGRGQWRGVPPTQVADVTFLHTANQPNILVRVVARGLTDASSFAFLPDGSILVTEKEGRLRVIRDGVLDPTPLLEIAVDHGLYSGLTEVALHPDFARNHFIYLTYARPDGGRPIVLARARLDDGHVSGLETLFESSGGAIVASASRILFAPDGTLFMSVAGAFGLGTTADRAQDPQSHAGKILRLTDDGRPAPGNPFLDDHRYLPEIYSLGHRNPMGLALHPVTGELWADEHGPQGGD